MALAPNSVAVRFETRPTDGFLSAIGEDRHALALLDAAVRPRHGEQRDQRHGREGLRGDAQSHHLVEQRLVGDVRGLGRLALEKLLPSGHVVEQVRDLDAGPRRTGATQEHETT